MLIDEHSNADARHVEPVQEIVDAVFDRWIHFVRLAHFNDAFRYGRHDVGVSVANFYQRVGETVDNKSIKLDIFYFD